MQTKLMFSQGDSPASHSAQLEKGSEKKISAIYGRRCLEQSKRLGPVTLSEKTYMDLLTGMEGWFSKRCALIWKKKTTKYGRSLYQLYQLGPSTEEIAFGSSLLKKTHSIPTPTASDHIERKSTSKEVLNFHTNKSVSLDRWFRKAFGTALTPEFSEILMGYPIGWTEL